MKKKDNENGVIIVEASIVVPLFIFFVITFLSLIDICMLQMRINIALNTAAKDISQYSYLYMMTGLNEEQEKLYNGSEGVRVSMNNTLQGLQTMTNSWIPAGDGARDLTEYQGDFNEYLQKIENVDKSTNQAVTCTKEEAQKIYKDWSAQLSDPQAFMTGVISLAGNELSEKAKSILAEMMGKAFMSKNLRSSDTDTAEQYLARQHVVPAEGSYINGLDFSGTKLFANGQTDRVQLVCTYEVEVIKLLNISYKFKFQTTAITRAWGKGISSKS